MLVSGVYLADLTVFTGSKGSFIIFGSIDNTGL